MTTQSLFDNMARPKKADNLTKEQQDKNKKYAKKLEELGKKLLKELIEENEQVITHIASAPATYFLTTYGFGCNLFFSSGGCF
jgi:flagellar motility protein MotE (MotC chaperone)